MAYTTIKKPSDYFNTVLHSGDGTSPEPITGFGFQPDLVWTKTRSNTNNHTLFDSVRGAGAGKELSSNSTTAENGVLTSDYGYISSFDSDGFTATSGSLGINYFNYSGDTYVNWGWLASNTTASNTDGSITSTVSANTTSGFSIVSYTGNSTDSTIGHGLGQKPDFIMVKERDSSSYDWVCYHSALGAGYAIALNLTDAAYGATGWNNSTEPTSTVFSVDSAANSVNKSGSGFIAYCFAEKKGFSKFGSYTGNGSADGTFVYTGFKPAWVIIKNTSSTGTWIMKDNKRDPFNVANTALGANLSAPGTDYDPNYNEIDILSNGFKLRDAYSDQNTSGATYIYMAFAEEPLVGDNPATAR